MQDRGAVIPIRVHTIVISVQHDEEVSLDEMRDALKEKVIKAVVPPKYLDDDTIYHLQPSGRFVIGGPQVTAASLPSRRRRGSSDAAVTASRSPRQGDAGLTGRKIIVDTYGGWGAHGGGAFSGKDYTKVDRSAAYAARWVAKSLIKAGLCRRVLVQVGAGGCRWVSPSPFLQGGAPQTKISPPRVGLVRHRGVAPPLHLHLPLRHLAEERAGAAGDRQEELRPSPRGDRQVTGAGKRGEETAPLGEESWGDAGAVAAVWGSPPRPRRGHRLAQRGEPLTPQDKSAFGRGRG